MKHLKSGIYIIAILIIAGCAHHRDVRPGANGVHRVVIQTDDQDEGTRGAIDQANHFCEQRKLSAAFVDEKKTYTGSMKEADYKTAKRVSKAAQAVGGAASVFGGQNEQTAGGIVGMGGVAADIGLGKEYTVEMKFKCQ